MYALSKVTADDTLKDTAIKLCDFALTLQQDNGQIISFKGTHNTEVHPHTYAVEGLMYIAQQEGNQTYADASKKAIEWSLSLLQPEGGIARSVYNDTPNTNERVDVIAQTLRMATLLDQSSDVCDKLEQRMLSYQNDGFRYGYDCDGNMLTHTNAWVSMFALQALSYRKKKEQGQDISLINLI